MNLSTVIKNPCTDSENSNQKLLNRSRAVLSPFSKPLNSKLAKSDEDDLVDVITEDVSEIDLFIHFVSPKSNILIINRREAPDFFQLSVQEF